jgi:hypothetical protein
MPKPARFIYLCGPDGVGKSTHAALLLSNLKQRGVPATHVWLRYPFFLSIPLLVYARWRRLSWYEWHQGNRYGHWDFSQSLLLRHLLPWTLLLDAALVGVWRIRLPLWLGRTLVCERYVLDMLVDIELALKDPGFHNRLPGRCFLRLLPRDAQVILLDLEISVMRRRRPDLIGDRHLDRKVERYRSLRNEYALPFLSNQAPVAQVSAAIRHRIDGSAI